MKIFTKALVASGRSMMAEDGLMVAGFMAFSAVLAFFPFLLCIAAMVSFVGTEQHINVALSFLFENVPVKVAEALEPVVREVLSGRKAGFLTFGIVIALWAASNGVEALRQGLNKAYGIDKLRPFWLRRLQNFAFVLFGTSILATVGILLVLGPVIVKTTTHFINSGLFELSPVLMEKTAKFIDRGLPIKLIFSLARYGLSILLMIAMLTALHSWLPNRAQKLKDVMPGVLLTVLLFILAATAFSLYLSHFANYSVTYGSIAGIVVAMLFFYLTSVIFIFGGFFNRHLIYLRGREAS